jgi:hypothetical protein
MTGLISFRYFYHNIAALDPSYTFRMTYAAIYHVNAVDISHYEVIYHIAARQYLTYL